MPTNAGRTHGEGGREVAALGLGSWQIYDRIGFDALVSLVRTAIDHRVNFFDIATYGAAQTGPDSGPAQGDVLFGRAIEAAGIPRQTIDISCKVWLSRFPEESLRAQLNRTLERIGTSYADYIMIGNVTPGSPPVLVDLLGQVGDLFDAHLVRHGWGVCNWSPTMIRASTSACRQLGVQPPGVVQARYSLRKPHPIESPMFERLCDDTGIMLQAVDALAGGLLLGKTPTRRVASSGGLLAVADLDPDMLASDAATVRQLAAQFGCTPAQLCLAFCLANRRVSSVIFGATSLDQLAGNAGALDVVARHGADALRALVGTLRGADDSAPSPDIPL